jgi:hypothetical protein
MFRSKHTLQWLYIYSLQERTPVTLHLFLRENYSWIMQSLRDNFEKISGPPPQQARTA